MRYKNELFLVPPSTNTPTTPQAPGLNDLEGFGLGNLAAQLASLGSLGNMGNMAGLGNLGNLGSLGNFGNMGNINDIRNQVESEIINNPEMFRQLMNNPFIQGIMNDPDNIRMFLTSNPQMRELIDVSNFLIC